MYQVSEVLFTPDMTQGWVLQWHSSTDR